jgi:RND family efflux transporter MFP subunit
MKAFFIKNYIVVGILVLLAAGGAAYWYISTATPPAFGSITVGKGNVIESVDEPGSVLAENSAMMSFQEGGQIAHVYVSEGSQVSAGTVLADLDSAQLNAAVQQANAGLAAAQAQLDQLASGTRPQQITIDESAVTSADQSLGIAVGNAYSASDDAVRNQLDNMFSNPQSNNPTFLVPDSDSQTVNNIQGQWLQIGASLTAWYTALNATSTGFDPATLAGTAASNLSQIQSYIDTIALAVNGATPNTTVPAATLAQYKADVATARAEIEASISAVSGDQSALTAAQNVLSLAQAGSTPQAIEAQQAVVAQAQAALTSAQVALNNASLVAPFSGTVQDLTAQVGQVVSPGTPMMSLINEGGLKIQAYVSEKDVANVRPGDAADVTLDAFGTGTAFPATVTTVDAAETQVNGSAAYLVTLHFENSNGQIKDGMTGNVHIIEAEHDNVIIVPSNFVINNGNDYFVVVPDGKTTMQQPVTIGIVGASTTEITSGLSVGETISNF